MREILPPIILPSQDHLRLEDLVADALRDRHPVSSFLMSELNRAHVCNDKEVPPDVVRLNDWVTYRMDDHPRCESKILVFPQDFSNELIHLSVLSLLGAAVLGLRAGDRLQFLNFKGNRAVVTVESIGAQPDTPALFSTRRRKGQTFGPPVGPDDGPTAA
jgi:regulator of nucleoside diphosphate kinase